MKILASNVVLNSYAKQANDNEKNLPGTSNPDIMGKYGGLIDIIMSMNSINTIYHRNP
jgi:hypothetical protein